MSDGCEEREERKIRLDREKLENREDRILTGDLDEGEPERVDS